MRLSSNRQQEPKLTSTHYWRDFFRQDYIILHEQVPMSSGLEDRHALAFQHLNVTYVIGT